MLQPSTIQLLRFHFSFFLLPVYLFALSQVPSIDVTDSLLIFFILHFLVYPSSNGYNSYMDRDEESIGGIAKPLPPTRQLFTVSIVLDILALLLCLETLTNEVDDTSRLPCRCGSATSRTRSPRPQRGRDRETVQAGVELVGAPAPEGGHGGDSCVLSAALDAVGLEGLSDRGLGDASLYSALL